jgi:hypothetical protein
MTLRTTFVRTRTGPTSAREIGYACGKRAIARILLVRTTDGIRTHGNEYLQLYRNLDLLDRDQLAVWQPGQTQGGVLVKNL